MIPGEIRCLKGGVVLRTCRYHEKRGRSKKISDMVRTWGDIEVIIKPDDIEVDDDEAKVNENVKIITEVQNG